MYCVALFVFGLLIGSFLNVCIYRIPRGESIVFPPSHCTNCGTGLKAIDLVPVLSFIFLKARCRSCGEKISFRYPAIELLTALIFSAVFYKYGLSIDFLVFSFLISILIAVFFIDIDHRIIPDELVLTGLSGGALLFLYNIFSPVSIYADRKWWNPLLGMAIGSGFLLLVSVVGMLIYKTDDAMGMGDVKIFAPIGIFLGWRMTIAALFISIVLAGLSGVLLMLAGLRNKKDTFPFGPYIVAGTFITVIWGWELLGWYVNRFF
jgi:leader peptidase (prepilin peptidase) / N-methyltransferase